MIQILFYLLIFWILFKFFLKFKNFTSWVGYKSLSQDEAKFLVALLAKVAKGDGRVSELEAQLVSQTLDDMVRKTGVSRDDLRAIFNTEKKRVDDTYELALEYATKFRLNRQVVISRLTFFLNLAYIDGEFNDGERMVIDDIARGFGVDKRSLETIIYQFEAFYQYKHKEHAANQEHKEQEDPYEILGVSKNADFGEIKRRYRELVKQYHPDILMGRGESEDIIQSSTAKLQKINLAYERLKAKYQE